MQFTDAATLSGTRRTSDGFMVADAFAVRTGIQLYTGKEVGLPDKEVVRVYRPEDEVRAADSVQSFSHAPVTLGHPKDPVTEDNWKQLAVGEVSTDAAWQDGKIRMPLILKDAAAIAAVEGGTRQLSAGYTCRLEFVDGVTPEGEAYDAIQREIRANHLAIVPLARGGAELRIGDGAEKWGASPVTLADRKGSGMTDIKLRTVVVGDEAVNTTDEGARAIEKLKGQVAALDAKVSDEAKAHTDAIKAKDTEIGTLKAELKSAQDAAKVDIDKLVADRATLVGIVRTLDAKIDVTGKTDAELRKSAVAAKLGDDLVKDASEAEIAGMFKAVSKDAKPTDPVAAALKDGKPVGDAVNAAHKAMTDHMTGAWNSKGVN